MPFWANYQYHPPMHLKPLEAPSNLRSEILADATVSGMHEEYRLPRESLLEAQVGQLQYADGQEVTFNVRNRVLRSSRHFRTTRPSKQPDFMSTGPSTVHKIIYRNAYKLDLPKILRNHKVFHVTQLQHYTQPVVGQPSSEPHPVSVNHSEHWEVEWILDSKQC
jgi:hypothetical protein